MHACLPWSCLPYLVLNTSLPSSSVSGVMSSGDQDAGAVMNLQVNGWWNTNARMRPYCENVHTLLNQIPHWSLQWVNRREHTPLSSTLQAGT